MGNDNFTAAPSGAFATGDGLLNIAANKQEQFEALVAADRPRRPGRPTRASPSARPQAQPRRADASSSRPRSRRRPRAEWEAVFNRVGVPAGRVLTRARRRSALPQVAHRELLQTFDDVPGRRPRRSRVARAGFKLSDGDPRRRRRRRRSLGEHTDEVLRELGYTRRRDRRAARARERYERRRVAAEQLLEQAQRLVVDRDHRHPARARSAMRGYPIQELIGARQLPADDLADAARRAADARRRRALLEAALVAAVDHGPHAPSIAISRMAVTCGLPLNGAMASAINVLGDVHGGAGQQCMELFAAIAARIGAGEPSADGGRAGARRASSPRTARSSPASATASIRSIRARCRCSSWCATAQRAGDGERAAIARIARAIERSLGRRKGRPIPMNIDGATAVIYCELGFAPPLGRGLFILSRSVGILAHAWEQTQQGGRIKGPMPPEHSLYATPAAARDRDHADERSPSRQRAAMKELISHQLVKYLEDRGVEHVFGLCGHTNIAVLAALAKSRDQVRQHAPRADRGAHAPTAMRAPSAQTAVVLSHLGPGLTNASTGVANAALDSIPMVVIAGDVPEPLLRQASAPGSEPARRRVAVRDLPAVRQARLARRAARPVPRDHREGVPARRERPARPGAGLGADGHLLDGGRHRAVRAPGAQHARRCTSRRSTRRPPSSIVRSAGRGRSVRWSTPAAA